jgi:hypothetical protein
LFGTDLSEAVGILKETSEDVFTIRVVKAPDQLQGFLFNRVDFPTLFSRMAALLRMSASTVYQWEQSRGLRQYG